MMWHLVKGLTDEQTDEQMDMLRLQDCLDPGQGSACSTTCSAWG